MDKFGNKGLKNLCVFRLHIYAKYSNGWVARISLRNYEVRPVNRMFIEMVGFV